MNALTRILRHLWLDAADASRALGEHGLRRLEQRVSDSERRHDGEICLCVEASLPPSYLWRHLRHRVPIATVVHERALSMFGRLRVWDTELNNGVLIYVQLAEHRVEIIADRGLAPHVTDAHWRHTLGQVADACRRGRLEDGLNLAIDAVGRTLETHFPRQGMDAGAERGGELDNRPLIR